MAALPSATARGRRAAAIRIAWAWDRSGGVETRLPNVERVRTLAAVSHALSQLGFPPDARVLIVNADDLGMHASIDAAIVESFDAGIVSSCSLMPPCPSAAHAMDVLRERPDIPFGVHLTLVCDTVEQPWGPLTAPAEVPSLLDGAGELHSPATTAALLATARLVDVEREVRAQIELVVGAGLAPTHLDWHCLADGGRDDIRELTLAVAAEYGLAARVWLDPARSAVRRSGRPVVDHPFVDSFALGLDARAERYVELLRALPPGLSEWAVHPGLDDVRARTLDPGGWRVRAGDHAFLVSDRAREVVAEEGIVIIDYRPVRDVWRRTG